MATDLADTLEIERSFIFKSSLPGDLNIDHSVYHEIGYLIAEDNELRIFKKKLLDGWHYAITVKSDGNLSRKEWEVEIPEWTFNELWPKTENCRVIKTRHWIRYNNWWLEVDEYYGSLAGLIRIECEFSSEEEAASFILPEWAQEYSDEVTENHKFKNKNLAKFGLPNLTDM